MGFGSSSVSPAARERRGRRPQLDRFIQEDLRGESGRPRIAETTKSAKSSDSPHREHDRRPEIRFPGRRAPARRRRSWRRRRASIPPRRRQRAPRAVVNSSSLPSLSSAPGRVRAEGRPLLAGKALLCRRRRAQLNQPSAAVPSRVPAAVQQATENERAHWTVGCYCIAPTCVVRGSACRDEQALLSSHQWGPSARAIPPNRRLGQCLLVLPILTHAPHRWFEELGSDFRYGVGKEFGAFFCRKYHRKDAIDGRFGLALQYLTHDEVVAERAAVAVQDGIMPSR